MSTLLAFAKKEITERIRSVRLFVLLGLAVLLGVLNFLLTWVTPLLFEMLADPLAASGLEIGEITVSALDSWLQFFSNISIGLIVFLILEGRTFTGEYSSGTLILSLTKGLARFKVVIAKASVMTLLWTVCFWLCFAVTYVGNEFLWDNSVAQNLALSGILWWLFGVWAISMVVLFSTAFRSGALALLGPGGIIILSSIIELFPKIDRFMPSYLMNGTALVYGTSSPSDFLPSTLITLALTVVCFAVSVPIFNKKQL